MLNTIKNNVLMPMLGRVGTSVATVLVGYGVNATHAEQIGIGVAAAALVTFDLVVSYVQRRQIAKGQK